MCKVYNSMWNFIPSLFKEKIFLRKSKSSFTSLFATLKFNGTAADLLLRSFHFPTHFHFLAFTFHCQGSSETTCWQWQPSAEPLLGLLLDFHSSPWAMGSTHQDRPGIFIWWRRTTKLASTFEILQNSKWTNSETKVRKVHIFCFSYVGYPGKLFLNMLKCLIIPLVVPSLIASIGSLDFRMSGKVWADQLHLFTKLFFISFVKLSFCTSHKLATDVIKVTSHWHMSAHKNVALWLAHWPTAHFLTRQWNPGWAEGGLLLHDNYIDCCHSGNPPHYHHQVILTIC